jgi:hypothetical protein
MKREVTVTSLFPHFVDAQQSAMRGLNIGWYAIDQDGEIARGLIAAATNASQYRPVSEWHPGLESALAQTSVRARKPVASGRI